MTTTVSFHIWDETADTDEEPMFAGECDVPEIFTESANDGPGAAKWLVEQWLAAEWDDWFDEDEEITLDVEILAPAVVAGVYIIRAQNRPTVTMCVRHDEDDERGLTH